MKKRTRKRRVLRVPWHTLFGRLLMDRGPSNVEVILEFPLGKHPQRIDYLLLRQLEKRSKKKPRVLLGLWPLLKRITVTEFKSKERPYRPGGLVGLLGYACQYHFSHFAEVRLPELSVLLLMPCRTPSLDSDLEELGWSLESLGGGYWSLGDCVYPGFVAFLDDVSDAERDDLIGSFGHRRIESEESAEWLTEKGGLSKEVAMAKIEGFESFVSKLASNKKARSAFFAGIRSDKKARRDLLAAFPARELLADLSRDEVVRALPDDVLRELPPEFLAKFSPETRRAIARRLKRPTRH